MCARTSERKACDFVHGRVRREEREGVTRYKREETQTRTQDTETDTCRSGADGSMASASNPLMVVLPPSEPIALRISSKSASSACFGSAAFSSEETFAKGSLFFASLGFSPKPPAARSDAMAGELRACLR